MSKRKNDLLDLNLPLENIDGITIKGSGFKREYPTNGKTKKQDLLNKYNRLTILGVAGLFEKFEAGMLRSKNLAVLTQCDCGTKSVHSFNLIKKGVTKSCGCLELEAKSKNGKKNIKHGATSNLKEKVEFRKDLKIKLEIEFGKKGINERLKNYLNDLYPEMITVYPKRIYKEYNPLANKIIERKKKDVLKDKKTDYEILYNRYKKSANRRRLEFSLSFTQDYSLLIDMPCDYCGDKPKKYNGIDRIYNKIGYTKENSVPCCEECNFMKGRYDREIFLKQCFYIAEAHKNTVKSGAGIMTPA